MTGTPATPPGYVAPAYYAPAYAHPAAYAPAYVHPAAYAPAYAQPTANAPAYVHPAAYAPAYYSYWSGQGSNAMPAAAPPGSLPVASRSYLSNMDPDAPMIPGSPNFDPASPLAKGSLIMDGVRAALKGSPGMLFGGLLQVALKVFGEQFGLSPNNQDYSVLTDLVQKVLGDFNGAGGTNGPGVSGSPSATNRATQGAACVTFNVTVQPGATIHIHNPATGDMTNLTSDKNNINHAEEGGGMERRRAGVNDSSTTDGPNDKNKKQ